MAGKGGSAGGVERPLAPQRDASYRRRLLWLLSVATFFQGYDAFVLAFALPLILVDLGGTQSQAGLVNFVVMAGNVLAFFLAAQADRIGRRRLLLVTIVGYTGATLVTAFTPNLAALTGAQFVAQMFLGAEWAVAIATVIEEYPENERGRSLGIVTSMNTLGAIFVGILAFAGITHTGLGWRAFYLVGIVPLVVVAFGRRGLLETERYSAMLSQESSGALDHTNLIEPWKPEFRGSILAVGLLHFFRYMSLQGAVFWWAYYAQQEVGMSVSLTGLYLAAAGLLGAAGFLFGGWLMDRWGRRNSFILYTAAALVFGVALFQTHSALLMLPFLCITIFFGTGSGVMTSAFATELFPTYVRSRSGAWCRNAFEVPGGMLGPLLIGVLGDHRTGPIGSIGDATTVMIVATLIPVIFIAWRYVRESKGIDLAAMDAATAGAAVESGAPAGLPVQAAPAAPVTPAAPAALGPEDA